MARGGVRPPGLEPPGLEPPEGPAPGAILSAESHAPEACAAAGSLPGRSSAAVLDRHRFLAEAGAALLGRRDPEAVCRAAAEACLGRYADLCLVDVEERGRLRRAVAAHRDDPGGASTEPLLRAEPSLSAIAALVEESGGRVSAVGEAWRHTLGGGKSGAEVLRSLRMEEAVTFPLVAGETPSGFLTLASATRGRYGEHEIELLRSFAARAGLVLEGARREAALRSALERREQAVSIVAHDLRNPLGAIAAAVRNLLELDLSEEVRRRQLGVIESATDRMLALVRDLLEVTAIEQRAASLQPSRTLPRFLVDQTLSGLRATAETAGVELTGDVDPATPPVWADRLAARQILVHLVSEAIRHSPRGGRVAIRAGREDDAVRFRVIDEGPAAPEGELEALLEGFWESPGGRRRMAGRASLALTITRGLVDLHGGRFGAASGSGEGMEFWFTLPVAGETPSAPGAAGGPEGADRPRPTAPP